MHECNETSCYGWQDNRKMQNMWKIIHARRSSTDQEAIELLLSRNQHRWIENLSKIYRLDRKFLDGSRSYREELQISRWIENVLTFVEKRRKIGLTDRNLSRIYWEAVKLDKSSFSKRGKTHKWMQSSKLLNQRSKQHVKLSKTSLNKINAKHSWSKTHTHIH